MPMSYRLLKLHDRFSVILLAFQYKSNKVKQPATVTIIDDLITSNLQAVSVFSVDRPSMVLSQRSVGGWLF